MFCNQRDQESNIPSMEGTKILHFEFSTDECCLKIQAGENAEESSAEETEYSVTFVKENLFRHPTPYLLEIDDQDISGTRTDILSCSDSDLKRLPTLEELSKAIEDVDFAELRVDELKQQSEDISKSKEEIEKLNQQLVESRKIEKALHEQLEKEQKNSQKLADETRKLSLTLEESKREVAEVKKSVGKSKKVPVPGGAPLPGGVPLPGGAPVPMQ